MGFNSKYSGLQVEMILDALSGISYDRITHSFLFNGNIIATGGGAFRAALGDLKVPTIMDGVITDEATISKENGVLKVLKAGLDKEELLSILKDEKYVDQDWVKNYCVSTYAKKEDIPTDYVDLNSYQDIEGIKNFNKGLKISNSPVITYDEKTHSYNLIGNIVLSGSLVTHANLGDIDVPTIMDGVYVDNNTIIKDGGVIKLNPNIDLSGDLNTEQLKDYLDNENYARKSDINLALSSYATQDSLDKLTNSFNNFLTGSDTDTIINKWSELEAFLLGLSESDDLATILSNKANKATTLAGYGITDAYTKSHIDSTFVKLTTVQDITARHNFTNGLKIGGLPVYKSKDDVIYIDANLVVRGGFVSRGTNSTPAPSIYDGLPIDNSSIYWENGVLKAAIGEGGLDYDQLDDYLTTNGYATQSWVTGKGYITSASSISGNAGSASKLQSAVSLWGRTFDGSQDLTGSLTVTTGEGYRIQYNGYDLRFIVSGNSANRGIWDNTLNSWMMYRDDTENIKFPVGNIIIGEGSPSYKLHVRGTFGVSDVATFAGNVNLTSANSHMSIGGKEVFGSYENNFFLFDSAVTNGYGSFIVGKKINFQTGTTTKATVATFNENGAFELKGVLKLTAVDSGFTNPRIVFGDNICRIGLTTAGLLGIYTSGDVRINPNSVTSTSSIGLWLKTTGYNGINTSSPTQALHVNGKGIFADATNPWISLQRDGVNWYLQVVSTGLRLGRTSANAILVDETGNLFTPGTVTMNYSSDKRLKRNIRKFNAAKTLLSLGGVYKYEYIDSEVEKNHIYKGTHIGLIYQNVKGTSLKSMCYKRDDGMGALNYVDTSFISLIAGATMENTTEIDKLKKENKELKQRIKQLERRLV